MLSSSTLSAKEGLMGILTLPLELKGGEKKGSSQRLKWASDITSTHP